MQETKTSKKSLKANFSAFINNKFVPFAGKVGNQTHLSIIRDGFALITPLLIAGALAVLLNSVLFGNTTISLARWIAYWTNNFEAIDEATNNIIFLATGNKILEAFKSINGVIWQATLGVLSIYIAFLVGFLLSKRRGQDPAILCGVITLAVFFATGGSNPSFFGTQGLFSCIILSFLSGELYLWLQRDDKLAIKMPDSVPPAVGKAFAKLLPAIIVLFIFAIISQIIVNLPIQLIVIDEWNNLIGNKQVTKDSLVNGKILVDGITATAEQLNIIKKIEFLTFGSGWEITNDKIYLFKMGESLKLVSLIYNFFTAPFMTIAKNPHVGLGLALVYVLFVQIFWFFGLHGTNIMNGIFAPIWIYAANENTANLQSGKPLEYLFSQGFFDGFIFIGGWGLSLSLLIITLFIGRDKQAREVSKLAIVPGVFNINEPVTFAYPMMLNPILIIPSILGPLLLVIWTWFWMVTGVVPYSALLIPWVAPAGIGGYITTGSWRGLILALSNLILGILIYIPFILIANKAAKRNDTIVELEYLGKIHYLFTGKNYQDQRYQAIKKRQIEENKLVKTVQNSEEKKSLAQKHRNEWIEYKNILKDEVQNLKKEKRNKI